jgi:hypothetical protein
LPSKEPTQTVPLATAGDECAKLPVVRVQSIAMLATLLRQIPVSLLERPPDEA